MSRNQETRRPFYWTRPYTSEEAGCYVALSGWYQWTESGLKFLGESLLEQEALNHD